MLKYGLKEYENLCNNAGKLFMYTRRHESMIDNLYVIKKINYKKDGFEKNIDEISKICMSRCKESLNIKHNDLKEMFPEVFFGDDVGNLFDAIEMIRDIVAHGLLGAPYREDGFDCFRMEFIDTKRKSSGERNKRLASLSGLTWDGTLPFIFPITDSFVDEWRNNIFTFRESKKVALNDILQINLGDFY